MNKWLSPILAVMLVVPAACASGGDDSPSVGPVSVVADSRVEGDTVELRVTPPEGFEIVPADGDTSGETGHYHVFIDRDPVGAGEIIPTEDGIVHSAESPIVIEDLDPGRHRFVVVLGDGEHRRIGGSHGEITVEVLG